MLLPERNESEYDYRYTFQGQEKDDEIKGEGNSVNYKYRMHDPRVGRFFAVDPLDSSYPHYTPYSFSGNKVVAYVELEGQEELDFNLYIVSNTSNGETVQTSVGIHYDFNENTVSYQQDISTFNLQSGTSGKGGSVKIKYQIDNGTLETSVPNITVFENDMLLHDGEIGVWPIFNGDIGIGADAIWWGAFVAGLEQGVGTDFIPYLDEVNEVLDRLGTDINADDIIYALSDFFREHSLIFSTVQSSVESQKQVINEDGDLVDKTFVNERIYSLQGTERVENTPGEVTKTTWKVIYTDQKEKIHERVPTVPTTNDQDSNDPNIFIPTVVLDNSYWEN